MCDLLPLIFSKGNTDMDVYRARVTFLFLIGEVDFFSLVLLFGAVLLVTVLFRFQKAAINNALISKRVCILCCELINA